MLKITENAVLRRMMGLIMSNKILILLTLENNECEYRIKSEKRTWVVRYSGAISPFPVHDRSRLAVCTA